MNKLGIRVAIFCVFAFGAGFLLRGIFVPRELSEGSYQIASESIPAPEEVPWLRSSQPETEPTVTEAKVEDEQETIEEPVDPLTDFSKSIADSSARVERFRAILGLLDKTNPANATTHLKGVLNMVSTGVITAEQFTLFCEGLGAKGGGSILADSAAIISSAGLPYPALSQILKGWARVAKPEDVTNFLAEDGFAGLGMEWDSAMRQLIAGVLENGDETLLKNVADSITDEDFGGLLAQERIKYLTRNGGLESGFDYFNANRVPRDADGSQGGDTAAMKWTYWGETESVGVRGLLVALDHVAADGDFTDVSGMVRELGNQSPRRAAEWAAGAPLGVRELALGVAIQQWGRSDPDAAIEFIGSYDGASAVDQINMLYGLHAATATSDPEVAAQAQALVDKLKRGQRESTAHRD